MICNVQILCSDAPDPALLVQSTPFTSCSHLLYNNSHSLCCIDCTFSWILKIGSSGQHNCNWQQISTNNHGLFSGGTSRAIPLQSSAFSKFPSSKVFTEMKYFRIWHFFSELGKSYTQTMRSSADLLGWSVLNSVFDNLGIQSVGKLQATHPKAEDVSQLLPEGA